MPVAMASSIKDEDPNQDLQEPPGVSDSQLKDVSGEKKPMAQKQREGQGESESDQSGGERSVSQRKPGPRKFRGNQGKTMHPRQRLPPKELRELSRKHALLEKNLQIEGIPAPPKFRKRRLSLGSSAGRPQEKDSPYKRKRLASIDVRRSDHMPKWELMGGDAQDPLNLNGLADSEEGRILNLKTPESSPLPTPDFRKVVYVKVPPNIKDPLNLDGEHDQEEIDRLLNATLRKRHRTKRRRLDDPQQASVTTTVTSAASDDAVPTGPAAPETIVKTEGATVDNTSQAAGTDSDSNKPKSEQTTPKKGQAAPVAGRSRSRSISMSPERRFKRQLSGSSGKGRPAPPKPQFKYPENPKFTLGNYNRYYGYRNTGGTRDPRLPFFDLKWFKGKDVLDIGCNEGHLTLALADQFQPHKILGMDIDGRLIQAARQNIRTILSQRRKDSTKYPSVLEMTRGPLEAHPLMGSSDQFPNNVLFLQGNYVPGSEEVLNLQKEEYDTILALSITKWIHLNNGDNGLKLFFQKIFRQLRPGGKLILEPQPWVSYRKRAKLTPEMFSNYQSIKLKPEGFKHYLLSIGFVKCEVIGVPVAKAKGFRRPLLLFTKQDLRQTVSPSSSTYEQQDYSNICQECGSEDKTMCDHPQFAGMRRGPYASYLYDHVNYPSYASDSPLFAASQRANSSHNFSNSFGGYGGLFEPPGGGDSRDMDYSFGGTGRAPQLSSDSLDRRSFHVVSGSNSVRSINSNRSGRSVVSRGDSGSSQSWSSSGSGSLSGSHSASSTPASGASSSGSVSYYSPDPHGPNGDIAAQYAGADAGGNVYVNGDVEDEAQGVPAFSAADQIEPPNGVIAHEAQEEYIGAEEVDGAGGLDEAQLEGPLVNNGVQESLEEGTVGMEEAGVDNGDNAVLEDSAASNGRQDLLEEESEVVEGSEAASLNRGPDVVLENNFVNNSGDQESLEESAEGSEHLLEAGNDNSADVAALDGAVVDSVAEES